MKIPLQLEKNSVLAIVIFFLVVPCTSKEEVEEEEAVHSRQKRILWVTADGRLALPPGTTLVISPSLSMPFVRYPPDGFFSNMTISLPFTVDFNKLGLTDNENPYGVLPPLLARSMGRSAGTFLGNFIGQLLNRKRGKRAAQQLPDEHKHAFPGGERALLYILVEEFLENFGMNGKACLLRAICEVHAHPLTNYGLFGEVVKLFFTASKSPYADILNEYVEAENAGSGKNGGPAECWPYMKDCPKSLFLPRHNHYTSESFEKNGINEEEDENESRVTLDPAIQNM